MKRGVGAILLALLLGSLTWLPLYGASSDVSRSVKYGIASLDLQYYSTPTMLTPILNLTTKELGELLLTGEYQFQNPVTVNYGTAWYEVNQSQAVEGTDWVITVLDVNPNSNTALVVVLDQATGKRSNQVMLQANVPVDVFGDGSIVLTLKDTFVGIDGRLVASIETQVTVSSLRLTSKTQFWDLQRMGIAMGIMDGLRTFLAEKWMFYPMNQRVHRTYAFVRYGIDNRWSLMSATTPDGYLNASFLSGDRLFFGPLNPLANIDRNSELVWSLVHDEGGYFGFDGLYHPYRCTWTVKKGHFVVPNNAVIYNQTQGWIAKNTGKNATVKITYHCDFGQWHNGVSGGIDDIRSYVAFLYTWSYRDFKNDPYYDQTLEFRYDTPHILGFQWLSDGYVVYGNYTYPIDDNVTASEYMFYPDMPWELYWAMGELVANGAAYGIFRSYYFNDWKDNAVKLDLLNTTHSEDLLTVIKSLAAGKAAASFPSIDWNSAASRFNADVNFYQSHGHFIIGNGPYFIAEYYPPRRIRLEKFNGSRVIFTQDPTLLLNGNSNVIEFVAESEFNTAVLDISNGNVDIGLFRADLSKFMSLDKNVLQSVVLYPVVESAYELTVNPYHDPDKDAPIVTIGNSTYLNPFAIKEVRFAFNYLVNRSHVVKDILDGAGTLMLGGISPTDPAYPHVSQVYRSLGLSPEGDLLYALRLVDEGMKKAQQQVAKYGHTLEKRDDGYWYFDGQPIEVKFVIRTEDERKDIGLYVSNLIENYMGFKVDKIFLNREDAADVVFRKPISTYQWNLYTGGWDAGGFGSMYPDWQIYYWYSPLGYYPNFQDPRHQPNITVKDALEFIGGQYGDIGSYASVVQNASSVYFVFNNLGTPDAFSAAQYMSRTIPVTVRTVSMLADEFNLSVASLNSVIVSVGGPLVNRVTAKYDRTALVHMNIWSGSIEIITPGKKFLWNIPRPWWNVTQGYFVIQFFNDRTTGALVVTVYGTDADSTAAGTYYFMTQVYPNLSSYSGMNYLVGLWEDTEAGADIPLPGASQGDTSGFSAGDSITIVAMG